VTKFYASKGHIGAILKFKAKQETMTSRAAVTNPQDCNVGTTVAPTSKYHDLHVGITESNNYIFEWCQGNI
jgi:hypothetical protein